MKTDTKKSASPIDSTEAMKTMKQYLVKDFFDTTWKMVVPTVLGVAAGYGIDRLTNTSPLFFLIGAALGFVGGVGLAIKAINQTKRVK